MKRFTMLQFQCIFGFNFFNKNYSFEQKEKKKMAEAKKAKKSSGPTCAQKVWEAIKAKSHFGKGASRAAIYKWIGEKYPGTTQAGVRRAISKGVAEGLFAAGATSARFKNTEAAKAKFTPKPKKKKPKKKKTPKKRRKPKRKKKKTTKKKRKSTKKKASRKKKTARKKAGKKKKGTKKRAAKKKSGKKKKKAAK